MTDPIRIELSPEARVLLKHYGTAHVWIPPTIARAMKRENEFTVGHIKQFRFEGNNGIPFPVSEHKLGNRTNKLQRSIDHVDPEINGASVVSSIGTNVEYALVHELGFRGEVKVPAHTRTRKKTVRVERIDSLGKRRTVRKRIRGNEFAVRAYTYEQDIEARAPITTGVRERLPALGQAISADIVQEFGRHGMS